MMLCQSSSADLSIPTSHYEPHAIVCRGFSNTWQLVIH